MNTSLAKLALLLTLVLPIAAGCPGSPSGEPKSRVAEPPPQRTLHVLVIDDDGLAEAIERQWQARSDTAVDLQRSTSAEVIAALDQPLGADVVVLPSGLLGELAEHERIVPLGKRQLESANFNGQDVFEVLRRGETFWGETAFAVALGSPQLTIMYRQDIFESLELTPPTDWIAYQQLVDRLSNRDGLGSHGPPAAEPWYATREPLGDGWAGQLLLARAAAYVRHPHQYSTLFDIRDMKPLIDGPPFVKALEELVRATRPADDGDSAASPANDPAEGTRQEAGRAASPADVRADFLAGRCAMALTWPSPAEAEVDDELDGTSMQVGFAQLPGSPQVFNFRNQTWELRSDGEPDRVPLLASAGRLVALTRAGKRSAAANTMLMWLGGIELGNIVAPSSKATTLFRSSQVTTPRRWVNSQLGDRAASEYAELVRRTQDQSLWMSSIRIPARHRYLAALDGAVQRALAGESATDALAHVATQWEEVTNDVGRDKQKAAYMRCIGLEP